MFKKIKRYWFQFTHPIIGEVWQLHRVRPNLSDNDELRTYEITPKRLEMLIQTYMQKGYEFVSMDTVYLYVMSELKCKKKFVAVTLDDGYEDNYSVAYPIFQKYNVPFCVYVTEDYITGEKKASEIVDFEMLSMGQLKQLVAEPLCTIGGHTKSHIRLNQLPVENQKIEILHCKQWLENIIGEPILHYAFPYGDYTNETLELMREIGVRCSVAAWGGGVRVTNRPYDIPRILVTETSIE